MSTETRDAREVLRKTARFAVPFMLALSVSIGALRPSSAWAKPYASTELSAVESPDEGKVRELRDQEITQLRIALGRRSPSNRRADLYFRLAEIYVEAYRSSFLLEGRAHEKRLATGQEDKFIDRSFSKPFLGLAIKACQEVLSLGIPYPKLDQIYYFLGFSHAELGDRKQSLADFENLTRKFPESPFASEAYRELGDAAFFEGQFRKAQGFYEVALKRSSETALTAPERRPSILHKLAWTHYRTKQYDRAVSVMKDAISATQKSGEKFISLREEALRDMALFMTESGRVEEAIGYFQSVAGDKNFYPRVLEKLGKQYERNVEPVKATQVYESLLKTNPASEAAFRVLVKLVDLDLRQGRFREALGRLNSAKIFEGGDTETQVAAQNLRAMVRRTATEYHEKFRKDGNRANLEIAEAYYAAYLKVFLSKEDPRGESSEIQMYLAEVKRDLGKSKDASELYRSVVGSKDKRYAKEAGALWTASLAEAIKKGATSAKAGEPSELEKEYVDAADRLQESLGETPEAREAALKAAQVLAGYKSSQRDAIKRIQSIIAKWEKSPQAVTAARLWVQLMADQIPAGSASGETSSAMEDLSEVIQEVRKRPGLLAADQESGGKLKNLLNEQELRLKIAGIGSDEKKKNFAAAAKGYETLANESTQASQKDFAEKAYENAFANYAKMADLESMDRVSATWLKRFPKSPKALDSIRGSATLLLIQGRFDTSARLFEKAGRDGGDPSSLETAARLYEGLGDSPRAQSIWSLHLERYPKNANRWNIALSLARSHAAASHDSDAAKSYQYCMTGPAEFEAICGAELADLYLKNRNLDQAKAIFRKVAAQGDAKGTQSLSPFVAYARFQLADMLEASAKFEPLQLPEAQLKKAVTQRLEFLESLSRAYMSAVESGGPWGVTALGRLANWVMKFANELDQIPVPAGTSADATAKFRKSLENISGPLKRKATATWSDGYNKALSAELFSPEIPALADRLADGKAAALGRAQGIHGRFRIAGVPADGGADGRPTALARIREKLSRNHEDAAAWVDYGNLLWGDGKPLLAKIAYERSRALNPKNPASLNNSAVIALSMAAGTPGGDGQENWLRAAESAQLLQDATKLDEFFLPAKLNRALLLNYYRLFAKAKPLWEQVLVKDQGADVQEGLAIALQGLGEISAAEATFKKSVAGGANDSGFVYLYHEAARFGAGGSAGAEKCLSKLSDLDPRTLSAFERTSVEYLKGNCTLWKNAK